MNASDVAQCLQQPSPPAVFNRSKLVLVGIEGVGHHLLIALLWSVIAMRPALADCYFGTIVNSAQARHRAKPPGAYCSSFPEGLEWRQGRLAKPPYPSLPALVASGDGHRHFLVIDRDPARALLSTTRRHMHAEWNRTDTPLAELEAMATGLANIESGLASVPCDRVLRLSYEVMTSDRPQLSLLLQRSLARMAAPTAVLDAVRKRLGERRGNVSSSRGALTEEEARRYEAVGKTLLSSHAEFAATLGCATALDCTIAFHRFARGRFEGRRGVIVPHARPHDHLGT